MPALSASLGTGTINLLFPFPKWAIGDWHRYLHDKRRLTSGSLSQVGHIIWSTIALVCVPLICAQLSLKSLNLGVYKVVKFSLAEGLRKSRQSPSAFLHLSTCLSRC